MSAPVLSRPVCAPVKHSILVSVFSVRDPAPLTILRRLESRLSCLDTKEDQAQITIISHPAASTVLSSVFSSAVFSLHLRVFHLSRKPVRAREKRNAVQCIIGKTATCYKKYRNKKL
ncbi:hypothetical protein E2C01_033612 [Portunus trituberculatus]|uniref:Uncharacterized protein n=1 Tax=Portunus trituberculatus TaxID=210409 RepID=A0A5B7F483_PORTR|nr:hypothetical protein [Portunus trituberculatus]